jgi:hypothetical protein
MSSAGMTTRATERRPSTDGGAINNHRLSADSKGEKIATKSAALLPSTTSAYSTGSMSMSDLRQRQLQEMEKIRFLFEQNNLTFSEQAFERGLLVPEDRSVLDCVHNLPLAGSRLLPNPLVDLRLKKGLTKKKKGGLKKKKKKKGTTKGTKTLKSGQAKVKKA